MLASGLTMERFADRRELMIELDRFRAAGERQIADFDKHRQATFDLLTNNQVRDAFEVSLDEALAKRAANKYE